MSTTPLRILFLLSRSSGEVAIEAFLRFSNGISVLAAQDAQLYIAALRVRPDSFVAHSDTSKLHALAAILTGHRSKYAMNASLPSATSGLCKRVGRTGVSRHGFGGLTPGEHQVLE